MQRYEVIKQNYNINMAKIYSTNSLAILKMIPKKETISFLLNYSKALRIIKVGKLTFDHIAN